MSYKIFSIIPSINTIENPRAVSSADFEKREVVMKTPRLARIRESVL
jgi:hypothetical protein